jgi:hypothetical protein
MFGEDLLAGDEVQIPSANGKSPSTASLKGSSGKIVSAIFWPGCEVGITLNLNFSVIPAVDQSWRHSWTV